LKFRATAGFSLLSRDQAAQPGAPPFQTVALFLERAIRDVRPTEPLPGVAEDAVAHPLPELLGDPLGDGPADVVEPEIDHAGLRSQRRNRSMRMS
jgi:hypothetical protein